MSSAYSTNSSFPIPSSEPLEDHEECEEFISEFLSGRDLINLTKIDKEQKSKEKVKYGKEVKYDDEDTGKGKPAYKKYREEKLNERSKCDAQYINNLHTYYGDGSRLQRTPKCHYAVDFVKILGVDSEDTSALKNLEVSRKKVTIRKWISQTYKRGSLKSRLRRSVSCIHINFEEETEPKPLSPSARSTINWNASIHNVGEEFEYPRECIYVSEHRERNQEALGRNIARAFQALIPHVNAIELDLKSTRILEISKLLFSTQDLYAYAVPSCYDVPKHLKEFSSEFEKWRKTNVWVDTQPVKRFQNVVLELSEFCEEGTQFRRARHICSLWPKYGSTEGGTTIDLFVELDTGMLRAHKSVKGTVKKLPRQWAKAPAAIVKLRFKGAKSQEDVTKHMNAIRSFGQVYITSVDTIDRQQNNRKLPTGVITEKWSDLLTIVVTADLKKYSRPGMSRLFCEDKDCMGLCGSEPLYRKVTTTLSPLPTPTSTTMVLPWERKDYGTVGGVTVSRRTSERSVCEPAPPRLSSVAGEDHIFQRHQFRK
ncbi:unnamed protein product [Caenorhabditis sp. 36 PRJEB53466]|nr:unnamed protein product [Caenorhabditis sp. 36 PRJEB53466]